MQMVLPRRRGVMGCCLLLRSFAWPINGFIPVHSNVARAKPHAGIHEDCVTVADRYVVNVLKCMDLCFCPFMGDIQSSMRAYERAV